MKLCIDCIYHKEEPAGVHICQSNAQGLSVVTGEPLRGYCSTLRMTNLESFCGKDGLWFFPRPDAEEVQVPPAWYQEPTDREVFDSSEARAINYASRKIE